MSERTSPADREQEFINYVRRKRGPCPDNETLIAFQQKALPLDQAEEIQSHVQLCGSCQVALKMLERFEQAQAGEWPEPPDWPKVERRSRKRFYAFLESQKPPRAPVWAWLRGVVWQPALAYLLVLALAYPAYLGLFRKPEVVTVTVPERQIVEVEKPREIASLRTFDLRSPERTVRGQPSGEPSIVQLMPDEPVFALSFFVPISERPEFVYDVEIRDGQGRVVAAEKAARPRDFLRNFLLVCPRERFSPGQYELQVKEVNKTTQAVRRTFGFSFTVERGHG